MTFLAVRAPGNVIPINTVTGTTGTQIQVPDRAIAIAVTPDDKTIYVTSGPHGFGTGEITPISATTYTVGTPTTIDENVGSIAITL